MFELEIPRAQRDGLRDTFRNDPSLDSRQPCQRKRGAIVRVKALSLDHRLAQQPKPALVLMLRRRMCLGFLLRASGRRKNPDLPIGKHAVNVEEDQFDFFRSYLGHGTAILAFVLRAALAGHCLCAVKLRDLCGFSPCLLRFRFRFAALASPLRASRLKAFAPERRLGRKANILRNSEIPLKWGECPSLFPALCRGPIRCCRSGSSSASEPPPSLRNR